jgi:hypothetical protein
MNATTIIEALPPSARPAAPSLHVVHAPRDSGDAGLVMDEAVAARWLAIPDAERGRIAAFLRSPITDADEYRTDEKLPAVFAVDLARGGPAFRAAFPDLVRRVVSVSRAGDRTTVRTTCEGRHDAPFFRLFSATRRHVRFDVTHRLVTRDGRVDHRVVIDVRSLVVQLATAPKKG